MALIASIIFSVIALWAIITFVVIERRIETTPPFYSVHKEMVEEFCERWAWGTFDDFLKQFSSHTWHIEWYCGREPSFFDMEHDSEVHATIIKFDGIGMLLVKKDWPKFKKWLKEQSGATTKRIEHPW